MLIALRRFEFPHKLGVLERLFGRFLCGLGVRWVECWNGVVWKLDLRDVTHRWIVYGYYEGSAVIPWAARRLANGGVFVDSGANIGQWTSYLAAIPGVSAIAVEPVPSQRTWLEECIERQDSWRVGVEPVALGSCKGTMQIQCDGARSTGRLDWYASKHLEVLPVEVDTLDSILDRRGISRIDVWKLDVEGGEVDAVRGASGLFARRGVGALLFECHPSNFLAMQQFLTGYGYGLFRIVGRRTVRFVATSIPSTIDLVALPE